MGGGEPSRFELTMLFNRGTPDLKPPPPPMQAYKTDALLQDSWGGRGGGHMFVITLLHHHLATTEHVRQTLVTPQWGFQGLQSQRTPQAFRWAVRISGVAVLANASGIAL